MEKKAEESQFTILQPSPFPLPPPQTRLQIMVTVDTLLSHPLLAQGSFFRYGEWWHPWRRVANALLHGTLDGGEGEGGGRGSKSGKGTTGCLLPPKVFPHLFQFLGINLTFAMTCKYGKFVVSYFSATL